MLDEAAPVTVAPASNEELRPENAASASPYATGGGGVRFEHRVCAWYLGALLSGDAAPELGDGRRVVRVACQQAQYGAVDDLVVSAARGADEPDLRLAISVRRNPRLVHSDTKSRDLVLQLLKELWLPQDGPAERRIGLAVAGSPTAAEQLATLASLARDQRTAEGLFALVGSAGRFPKGLRSRLEQFERLVASALETTGKADVDVREQVWQLLDALWVIPLRLEEPDTADRAVAQSRLVHVSRGQDLPSAVELHGELERLAADFGPSAADVDAPLLRRRIHRLLFSATAQDQRSWPLLRRIDELSRSAVSSSIGKADGQAFVVDRGSLIEETLTAVQTQGTVLVTGPSGAGKSALAIAAADRAAAEGADVLVVNLQQLPATWHDLEERLHQPLDAALRTMSAPTRLLAIEGADRGAASSDSLLSYLHRSAREAEVGVIVTAADGPWLDGIKARLFGDSAPDALINVPLLSDSELDELVAAVPSLERLNDAPRSRDLLRRPVVADLLARSSGSGDVPLSDADAMRVVWGRLVRGETRPGTGDGGDRDRVMLELARQELYGGQLPALDTTALQGLRRDGVLRESGEDLWATGPQFAHEELRRYAVARLLLGDRDLCGVLVKAQAPRWALSAATLAAQQILNHDPQRLPELLKDFDAFSVEHGARWADVPIEAALTSADPRAVLQGAPELTAGEGLERVLRVLDQRHRPGLLDLRAAEPVIDLLLESDEPWTVADGAENALRFWLWTLAITRAPAGDSRRQLLLRRIQALASAGQAEIDERQRQRAEEEQQRPARQRTAGHFGPRRRRRARVELPQVLHDETAVELVSLLGPDIAGAGEQLLRRLVTDGPYLLAPAVEALCAPEAIAQHSSELLADLTLAYYADDERQDDLWDDGIRRHRATALDQGMWGWNQGSFHALLQADVRHGIAVVNQLVNHATDHRLSDEQADEEAPGLSLAIIGPPRVYRGDEPVWSWYRGNGHGPYPIFSALQALERVCDELLKVGVPLERVVALVLEGAESLATAGLVAGLVVRHFEQADRLLDGFFATPTIWYLESARATLDRSGLSWGSRSSEGTSNPGRRHWNLESAALLMTHGADEQRAQELREVGERLLAAHSDASDAETAVVQRWASSLNRDHYVTRTEDGQVFWEHVPPDEINAALAPKVADSARGSELLRIHNCYAAAHFGGGAKTDQPEPSPSDVLADLASAQSLLGDPPELASISPPESAAAVAARALLMAAGGELELADDDYQFAIDTTLARHFPLTEPVAKQASQAIPALLSGSDRIDAADVQHALALALEIARDASPDTKHQLARALDRLWAEPCSGAAGCHHQAAMAIATELVRHCALTDTSPRRPVAIQDPVPESLAAIADRDFHVERLSPGLRALTAAPTSGACNRSQAARFLVALLDAQRRGINAHEEDFDHHHIAAIAGARAILALEAAGEHEPLDQHLHAFADRSALEMSNFLRALAAAAAESPLLGQAARQAWPRIIDTCLKLRNADCSGFSPVSYGDTATAALAPRVSEFWEFMYLEQIPADGGSWRDPLGWADALDAWISAVTGVPDCVDSFLVLIKSLPERQQLEFGLLRIAKLVKGGPDACAQRCWGLSDWLIAIRPSANQPLFNDWQALVDTLSAAGNRRLAPYST